MTFDDPAGIPAEIFQERRRLAFERLGEGVMVLPAHGGGHGVGPRVVDRELYYLTGLTIPGCIAVLVGGSEPRLVVFVPERDPEAELWDGARPGPEEVGERIDWATCHARSTLATLLPDLMADGDRIVYRLGRGDEVERLVFGALARARARGARTGSGPRSVVDPGEVLDDLRTVKDVHELAAIRRACAITVEGHRAGVGAVAPGVGEGVVEATI
ncbi:MAG: Xaa-Pro aminopeptidase, partial [Gemmatimonadota bacterium]|nr:Xaa-Pro aminopeptidase [Gemmatimonadota bacterium]